MSALIPGYVKRMIKEESELSEKIEGLKSFLNSPRVREIHAVPQKQINLMSQQYDAMLVYRGALVSRITIALKDVIESVEGTSG